MCARVASVVPPPSCRAIGLRAVGLSLRPSRVVATIGEPLAPSSSFALRPSGRDVLAHSSVGGACWSSSDGELPPWAILGLGSSARWLVKRSGHVVGADGLVVRRGDFGETNQEATSKDINESRSAHHRPLVTMHVPRRERLESGDRRDARSWVGGGGASLMQINECYLGRDAGSNAGVVCLLPDDQAHPLVQRC